MDRWRLKDLASCFYTCHIPLDEEPGGNKRNTKVVATDETCNPQGEPVPYFWKNGEKNADLSCPRCLQDDYIVFLLRKDGEIDLLHDENSHQSVELQNANTSTTIPKGDDERKNRIKSESHADEIQKTNGVEEHNKTDSYESCESNQSDSSTSSFSFPVLGGEWIGSPAEMPKSQGKHQTQNMICHCCRF